ncbi:hypothetical protein XSR1_420011 [Xenorhabdus szentirmaii DSM 16338]|uniref:Uncharacterized protein n=1 Tax=Xenorhabdus szentirmaii DSM 16338 TaxID=1427518 RepID=W1J471_9GAMM|nr:hypothetical protein XSR1_420011 [Xenorhabdus szentirmaii DSM 16338]
MLLIIKIKVIKSSLSETLNDHYLNNELELLYILIWMPLSLMS